MNQNIPPDAPEDGYGRYPEDNNPYFANRATVQAPDLDAGGPALRNEENQRLNRKALLFLGGIILLLLIMGAWLYASVMNRNKQEDAPVREEIVSIPDAQAPASDPMFPDEPASQPIDVAPMPMEPLPPMPPPPDYSSDGGRQPRTQSPQPTGPTLMERRMLDGDTPSGTPQNPADQQAALMERMLAAASGNNQQPVPQAEPVPATAAQYIRNPDVLMVRGTYLRCILETRIVTDIAGYTSCILTEPVYSINGRSLLLPKGSKLLGQYQLQSKPIPRVAVIWDRITTPNGIDVTMQSPGIDNLGGAGHPGDMDAHWPSRIASAMLISLISDVFKYAAAKHGEGATVTYPSGVSVEQPFESNTAQAVQDLAEQAIEQSANRPVTVTINQGTMLTVYVSQDVDFTRVIANR